MERRGGGRELVVNGSGHETWRVARTPRKGPRREKRESESGGERRPAQESARFGRGRRALGFGRRDRRRRFRLRRLADFERIDPDWIGDVLELGWAEIGDREIKPPLHLTVSVLRQADRPGRGDAFEPRGDVDAIAHQIAVALLDNVAK